jgi:pimeloyl-ACP methyl ester carboxylesterase
MHEEKIGFLAGECHLDGTFAIPETGVPGILFLHGWSGSQASDLKRAAEIAGLGCLCLTFDLRGHASTKELRDTVTPRQNFEDIVAAYDLLVNHSFVDKSSIGVIASSYGAYLAPLLSEVRSVRWMSLRVPAIYRDQHWEKPKAKIDRIDLKLFRSAELGPRENRALAACATFQGDVLVIESESDDYIPHPTIANYIAAFRCARSLTYRMICGADHGLSDECSRAAYTTLLVNWIKEMVIGAR